nr:Gal-binding and CUB domains containing receptor 6 [Arenicola marina]
MDIWGVMCCILVVAVGCSQGVSITMEVCEAETFEGQCRDGQVMVVQRARYGRMQVGRCVRRGLGFLGCGWDVLEPLDQLCSGRRTCSVPVNRANTLLVRGNTCIEELVSYLEVTYQCVAVIPSNEHCTWAMSHLPEDSDMLISSHSTDKSGCGSLASPWVIETPPGQRINISMADFGWTSAPRTGVTLCDTYGYLAETALGINKTICGGRERDRHIHVSSSSRVDIQMLPPSTIGKDRSFLIQFKVVGCPDVIPPEHAWYKRNGSSAMIGCEWSESSWQLECVNNDWQGAVGNCSDTGGDKVARREESHSMSAALSKALIIALAVLVVVLASLIGIGYICSQRRKRNGSSAETSLTQQEGFTYFPGRALPLQPSTTIPRSTSPRPTPTPPHKRKGSASGKTNASCAADDFLHIWEMPLPQPGVPPLEPIPLRNPSAATLPCRSTTTGPLSVKQGDYGSRDDTYESYWTGTDMFYDLENGWVTMGGVRGRKV